jgi:hypothetical protein
MTSAQTSRGDFAAISPHDGGGRNLLRTNEADRFEIAPRRSQVLNDGGARVEKSSIMLRRRTLSARCVRWPVLVIAHYRVLRSYHPRLRSLVLALRLSRVLFP